MNKKVLIIAEAGVNHNASLETAKKMIKVAKECGADVVKFQTAKLDSLVTEYALMAKYQMENIGTGGSQKDMLRKLLLPFEDFEILAAYCNEIGIQFLSTPFDIDSIHFLNHLQNMWKIPSGEITNYPYLVEIAKTGKKVILSTGMSDMEEVDAAVRVLRSNGCGEITLLHCTSEYPAPMQNVNIKAMLTLKNTFRCSVGYSDHTQGIEIPIAAAALGATVIEKHFTLDKNMEGPDHKASLEPEELKQMVRAIRNIEKALGDGKKEPSESERKNIQVVRKSIVAKCDITAGELFSEDNITTKRPGTGINPMNWTEVIGKKAKKNFKADELIEL